MSTKRKNLIFNIIIAQNIYFCAQKRGFEAEKNLIELAHQPVPAHHPE
jgi:hypothetical protein